MYTDMEARHIVEVLDRKRKQLDNEIAKFIAGKETEYYIFERDLKAIIGRSGRKNDDKGGRYSIVEEKPGKQVSSRTVLATRDFTQSQSLRYQRDPEDHRQSALSRSLQEASGLTLLSVQNNVRVEEHNANSREELPSHRHAKDHSQKQAQGVPSERPAASRSSVSDSCLSFLGSHMQEKRPNRKGRQPTQHRPEDYALTHERELEFQGLFTPNFLPLLDSGGGDSASTIPNIEPQLLSSKSESHGSTPPNEVKRATTQSTIPLQSTSKHPTSPLRLSLPINTNALASTNSPRLSSSIPAKATSLSTSLHSSLRSPTSKKPRSPKRVHFEIDNVVVPPSSTPPTKAPTSSTVYLMPWPKEPTPPKEESLNPKHSKHGSMDGGKENFTKEQQVIGGERRTSEEPHDDPAPIQHHGKPSDDSDLAAAKQNADDEPTAAAIVAGAAETAGEEPEQMFPFDEDLADEEESEQHDADDDGTSSVHSSGSSMKLGSPNASSLPIDIIYPPKIDPRDE
ncbi:MAG: hypothetical protein M1830_005449 [Pleopsidium flavum]|nr:MAG: hypothetical protein M1830_005449 [Pleopsidium flavum]